uniref:Ephrin RBD domain-containing protein n=1 Tax=Steinernema glaseri TaxID=37863 RepID=A0A1I8A780_9BILA
MNRCFAVVSIAFALATYANAIGAGAEAGETPRPKPCDASMLKNRMVAGFYKNTFFYYAYGDNPSIDLNGAQLFKDFKDPYTFAIPWFVIPLVDNRVAVFFIEKKKLFYVTYELDDLSEHVKNGSARIMQFHEQTKHEAHRDGVGVELADLLKCATVTNKRGQLSACARQLNLLGGKRNDLDAYTAHRTQRFRGGCKTVFETEGSVSRSCRQGEEFFFTVAEEGASLCTFAQHKRQYFWHLQLLPKDMFKIDHKSEGFGVAPATAAPPATSSTPTVAKTPSTATTTIAPQTCEAPEETAECEEPFYGDAMLFKSVAIAFVLAYTLGMTIPLYIEMYRMWKRHQEREVLLRDVAKKWEEFRRRKARRNQRN